jgi:CubicO group peptidase (beta-lactamase class C family)
MRRPGIVASWVAALSLLGACALQQRPLAAAGQPREPARTVKVLADATAGQDRRFKAAFQEVDRWIGQKAFPGAVVAIGQHGKLVALKSFGKMDYSEQAHAVPKDALFDLASLTKVIATTTAAAILYDRKQLDLDAPVIQYIPEFAGVEGHQKVLVRHLLSHSSGLNSRQVLWKQANDRPGIMKLVYRLPLDSTPGEKAQYRDYNMIVMGEIVYRITGQRLDEFLAHNAFGPLGMKHTRYNPPAKWIGRIAPTEQDDALRHQMVRGVVHDENAFLMGGVSGHAGLFSSARDLSAIAQMWLNGGVYKGKRILSEATVHLFMERRSSPAQTTRALGWDTPGKGLFPGELASPAAIIHTGFTGTSIYIDPKRDAFLILLTNRVHPTRENNLINQARPAIHTAVLSILDRE